MINYDSIISAFDDKLTLLQWLQKVEKALQDSTLETANAVNVDDSHIKFTFLFADGTSIDTPAVYVKPGVDGKDGTDGVGFDTLENIVDTVQSVVYSTTTGAKVSKSTAYKTAGKTYNIPTTDMIPIVGQSGINCDATARADKLAISLDGYASAAVGTVPRKSSTGLTWTTAGGGGIDTESGQVACDIMQASLGDSSAKFAQVVAGGATCYYTYIADMLTLTVVANGFAGISSGKTPYISLAAILAKFNIPLYNKNIYVGGQLSIAASAQQCYPLTYIEGTDNASYLGLQYSKTIAYNTSVGAYTPSALTQFTAPSCTFTLSGVTRRGG